MLATYQTSKMMVQILFDSVCHCLGAPGHPGKPEQHTWPADATSEGAQNQNGKRRSARLELRSDEWDGIFGSVRSTTTTSRRTSSNTPQRNDSEQRENVKSVADARLAAGGTQRRRRSKSRGKSPDTIFRKRPSADHKKQSSVSSSSFSKFLSNHSGVATALCFATPIRDDDDDNSVMTATSDGSSAANTLNTAGEDDTIMFEVKYGSCNKKKRRPPMMLFPQFKVEDEKDELRRIVASDSHKSFAQE